MVIPLCNLEPGIEAVITDVADSPVQTKLLEMGLIPGEVIRLKYKAPFGDPLCIMVGGYQLALRKDVAQWISVEVKS